MRTGPVLHEKEGKKKDTETSRLGGNVAAEAPQIFKPEVVVPPIWREVA
jgi:hypothetical protein